MARGSCCSTWSRWRSTRPAPRPPTLAPDHVPAVRLASAFLHAAVEPKPGRHALTIAAASVHAVGSQRELACAAATPLVLERVERRARRARVLEPALAIRQAASRSSSAQASLPAARSHGPTANPPSAQATTDTPPRPTQPRQRTAHAPGQRASASAAPPAAHHYSRCTATRKCSAPASRAASIACTTTPCEA